MIILTTGTIWLLAGNSFVDHFLDAIALQEKKKLASAVDPPSVLYALRLVGSGDDARLRPSDRKAQIYYFVG